MNELTAFDELENRIRRFSDEFHRLKQHVGSESDSISQDKIGKVEQKIHDLLKLIDQLEKELSHE